MSVIEELIAAIEADPTDEGSQTVIADYLQAAGDPRGDLIILDHAERRGLLDDPAALDQLLLLAAVYGFPRAEPDDPPLGWTRQTGDPFDYDLGYEGTTYDLVHSNGTNYRLRSYESPEENIEHHYLDIGVAPPWSDEDEREILTILSDAIRHDTPFDELVFPHSSPIPFPQYPGCAARCYMLAVEFLRAHDLLRNEHGLAVRDYHHWYAIWDRLRAMQRA